MNVVNCGKFKRRRRQDVGVCLDEDPAAICKEALEEARAKEREKTFHATIGTNNGVVGTNVGTVVVENQPKTPPETFEPLF